MHIDLNQRNPIKIKFKKSDLLLFFKSRFFSDPAVECSHDIILLTV